MQCSKRTLSNKNYIEIMMSNNKHHKYDKLKDILQNIIKTSNGLLTDDFEISFTCSIPRFIIYEDKESIYTKQLSKIETELNKLYNDNIIQYAGYQ